MIIRKISGIEDGFFDNIDGTSDWYYAHISKEPFCDLYEAEEIVKGGNKFVGMSCALIHYPDGKVFKPFEIRENIYVDKPIFLDGRIYFLEVDFDKEIMKLIYIDSEKLLNSKNYKDDCELNTCLNIEKNKEKEETFKIEENRKEVCMDDIKNVEAEISLSEIEDCYNLMLKSAPVMITRDANEGYLEIIYPEKKKYKIGAREAFDFRDGEDMYFSKWEENPNYEEFVVIRDYNNGEIKKIQKGTIYKMPNGERWMI